MPRRNSYDVVVAGGGPAGATAAALVAAAGHEVLLLERERFPRFKIGESLMPATFPTLERIGVLDRLRQTSFPRKHSVQFFSASGRGSAPFYFSENDPRESAVTWQVLRSEFDRLLVENAAEHGAEVVHGATVRDFVLEQRRPIAVKATLEGGDRIEVGARVIVDATGQSTLLARKLRLKEADPRLRQSSIYTHFEGAMRGSGRDEGATLIMHTKNQRCWFWYIPLPDDRVSVGVVGPVDQLLAGSDGRDPQQIFERELARCPALVPRLEGARQKLEVKVMRDFSYRSKRVAGDGWVLVGDAYGFLDPIYSSGILLALKSAEFAADAINAGLADGDISAERLGQFEPTFAAGMEALRQMVYAFYAPGFSFARFLKSYPQHRKPIIELLTGDVFERDFGTLFDDMATMKDVPHAAAPMAAE